jgi:hypothetical protein
MCQEFGSFLPSRYVSLYEVGRVTSVTTKGPSHGVNSLCITFSNIAVIVPTQDIKIPCCS